MTARRLVSVVLPAYNEELCIEDCLSSLMRQRTESPFEVIVVDNGSTDATAAKAEAFRAKLPSLRVISEPRRGRGRARATGSAAASGDILIAGDTDAVMPDTWIESLASVLENHSGVVGVTSRSVIMDCSPVTTFLYNSLMPTGMVLHRMLAGFYPLNGFSSAYVKKAYLAAGGFDPESDACEDMELSLKISLLGRTRFLYQPAVSLCGRRFKHGFFRGYSSYFRTTVEKFVLRKRRVELDNAR